MQQSPWEGSNQNFHLQLAISASNRSHEQLAVQVYSRLITRTAFDDALAGRMDGYLVYTASLSLTKLTPDPAGGVDLDIPINRSASSGLPTFNAISGSGVYPLQLQLVSDQSVPGGKPLTTFLVYYGPPTQQKLSVAVVLPFHAAPAFNDKGQMVGLPSEESRSLASLVNALGNSNVKLSLAVSPQTLDALAAGSSLDKSTLVNLSSFVRTNPVQLLPETYVDVPTVGMPSAGLGGELRRQISIGDSVLAGLSGTPVSTKTWVVNGPIDDATFATLRESGASRFVLPDSDLSALNTVPSNTVAVPAQLAGSPNVELYAADAGLTSDFNNQGGPVLAANQLLAEMAMIQLEQPGYVRGVAVVPPYNWSEDPTFVTTLLGGLAGHPLLNPVTVSGLFSAVPADSEGAPAQRSVVVPPSSAPSTAPGVSSSTSFGSTTSSSTSTTISDLSVQTAAAQLLAGEAATIQTIRSSLAGIEAVSTQNNTTASSLDRTLLASEAIDVPDSQRQQLFSLLTSQVDKVVSAITLPRASSITLTSSKGQIPLTILSALPFHARIQLKLVSQKLIFEPFTPVGGQCSVPVPTTEICEMTLSEQNTTLKVPVQTRSSGVFPLDVYLYTPDESVTLAYNKDTVRSTAISNVGLIIIVLALLSLIGWWARDLHHGRRARRLLPPPIDEGAQADEGDRTAELSPLASEEGPRLVPGTRPASDN